MELLQRVTRMASTKYFYVVVAVAALFIGVALYIYRTRIAPDVNPEYVANKEFLLQGEEPANTAELMFFYANWCPLSKKAVPIWGEFRETYENRTINNYRLVFKEIDCSDSNDAAMQAELDSYKVDGFPTIKMLKGNEIIDFDANPTASSLEQFVTSVIGTDQPSN
jgi:thiol-disulfide isomerase/thioredoxin